MGLSELIRANLDRLVDEWAAYASRHIQVTEGLTDKEIRNSSRTLFAVIADDMDVAQSSHEQFEKSQGQRPDDSKPIFEQATEHANARVAQGFSLPDLASEFRAARASVMRLLDDADLRRGIRLSEVERFNEALDEVQAVSIRHFDRQLNQARDMFLGVLGHDLRNPLSAILNGVKVLLRDESISPASAKVSARIYSSSKRIHSMIDDLLDFTRTKLGKGLPVALTMGDMGETVGQVVEELRDRNPAARIQYEASGELHGRWDFARFAQVVSNLGGNAIQHGDNAHPVSVRLQGEEDRIVLTVRNQGPPIGPSALHRIFDPLTRGSESESPEHKGSLGLGLYICREIALAHGGTIEVTSDGNGTMFEVGIPRQVEPRRRATDV